MQSNKSEIIDLKSEPDFTTYVLKSDIPEIVDLPTGAVLVENLVLF
jgi:hypothetical protein